MACAKKRGEWESGDLEMAIREVQDGSLSVRRAAEKYSIPKSTVHDHIRGRPVSRPGPSPVLNKEEENELVDWIIKMAEIGYGQCKLQVCRMVKKMLDQNGRSSPFPDNLPGKDWWYAFLNRHPQISVRTPQALETQRAKACTPSAINKWYADYEQFLLTNDLIDKPNQIWNCDESGFSLCPKSRKVLAPRGAKTVYYSSSSKGQITTLACINAAGGTVPPMHIFPGVRFAQNPMEGCVEGAYFGKSDNGWITQELFYGWLTKHFVRYIPKTRPTCLLVDGHASHIDLETSKFCKDNGILLYCLPPHSSHITQPLDVGFFSPLKKSWSKSVMDYNSEHPGVTVDKYSFAPVFRKAYLATVKPMTIINAFRSSGIYPPDRLAIDEKKLQPAQVYEADKKPTKPTAAQLALSALEEELDEEMLTKTRLEEGYDLQDPVYSTWMKLKQKSDRVALCDVTNKPTLLQVPVQSSAKPVTSARSTVNLPKHISGAEVIKVLEERKAKKEREEIEKQERQKQREENRKKREMEKLEKAKQVEERREERRKKKEIEEKKKAERKQRREMDKQRRPKQGKQKKKSDDAYECPACNGTYGEDEGDTTWIECEACCQWYHLQCTTVAAEATDSSYVCEQCT